MQSEKLTLSNNLKTRDIKGIFVFWLIYFSLINFSYSQKFDLGYETGYQWYKMEDLRFNTDRNIKFLSFDAKVVENYPNYFNHHFFLQYITKWNIGLGYRFGFYSTGSRISRKDYSGEYILDCNLKSSSQGIYISYIFYKNENFSVGIELDYGKMYNKLNWNEELVLYDLDSFEDSYEFKSKNSYWGPSLYINYSVSIFTLGFKTGFIKNRKIETLEESKYVFMNNGPSHPIGADWSGFYVNLNLSMNIITLFQPKE